MNAIVSAAYLPTDLAVALASHAQAAAGAFSPNTERALRADIAVFTRWCAESGMAALPAAVSTVTAFIDAMGALKAPATVRRYTSSIATFHKAAGLESPTADLQVTLALKRLHRAKGRAQQQAAPLTRAKVERLMESCEGTLKALRDKALLGLAYDSLCRRSELCALQVTDLEHAPDGSGTIIVRRSKTDQAGAGSVRYVAADTMRDVTAWLAAAGISEGPLFRSVPKGGRVGGQLHPGEVARRFKAMATEAGLKAKDVARISGHSTRVGGAVDQVAAGVGLPAVMQSGGWSTPSMVARYSAKVAARQSGAAQLAAVQGRG